MRLHVSDADRALIEEVFPDNFHQWLIVSKVTLCEEELEAFDVCQVQVGPCEGTVCPRCWNITDSHAEDGLCDRCRAVLDQA